MPTATRSVSRWAHRNSGGEGTTFPVELESPADLNRRMLMGIDYERAIEKFRKWHNMNEYQEHNARRCLFYSRRSDSLNLDDDIQEKVRHERVAIGYFNMILVAESEKYIPK